MLEMTQSALGVLGTNMWSFVSRYVMPAILAALCVAFLPFVMMIGMVSTLPRILEAIIQGS